MTLSAVKLRRSPLSRLALTRLSVGAAACALLAACANAPTETPTVTQAATAYDAARNDPKVVSSAPLELQRAEQALKVAQDCRPEARMSPWSIIRRIWRKGAPISLPRPHSSRTRSSRSNRPISRAIRPCSVPVPVRSKAFNISWTNYRRSRPTVAWC